MCTVVVAERKGDKSGSYECNLQLELCTDMYRYSKLVLSVLQYITYSTSTTVVRVEVTSTKYPDTR